MGYESFDYLALVKDAPGYDVETLAHYLVDDVYTKVFVAKKAGTYMGQHSHTYDHGTLVVTGSIRLYIDKKAVDDYHAPAMIRIKAHTKHILLALEDNTTCACIHNAHGETEPNIHEEATLG